MKTQITTQIKEQIGTHFKTQIKTVVRYWLFFIAAFIFWELMLRIDVSGGISPDNLWLLSFIPAEALIPVILCGWFGKRSKGRFIADRVIFVVVTALFAFYYIVQLVYSRVFGSLFSVSLLGMGKDAMGDFGWTINGVLIGSIGMMIVFCIPVFAAIAVGFFSVYPKDNIKVAVRIGLIPLVVLVWFGGLLFTRIGGTQRNSAYNVFHDTMLDTDTTAAKIGALTTTVVETGSYVFGIGIGGNNSDGDADLSDVSALTGSVQPVKLAEKNESTAEKGKEDNNTSSSASADNNSEDTESAEQTEPEDGTRTIEVHGGFIEVQMKGCSAMILRH